jgi:cytochrome oxidase Cu insertion factor (SCO1/SenC/PrrC family)
MKGALSLLTIFFALPFAGCQSVTDSMERSCAAECAHCVTPVESKHDASAENTYATEWLAPSKREPAIAMPPFQDQQGRKVTLADLRGAPIALSFIYTRCENQRKCPLVAKTMAELQTQLDRANVTPRPRLALITYDPEYDTPEHLKSFGETYGLRFTETAMLLRPETTRKQRLFDELNVRVNFNDRGVNLHGVQLILLDKQGRFVRAHHTLIWENAKVLEDLKHLAME